MFNKIKNKIVIIGAGYAGISFIEKIKDYKDIEITLIDKSSFHLHQTDIHKFISGKCEFKDVAFDLNKYSKNKKISFINACVKDVLFDDKKIVLNDTNELSYDYLIIAAGSVSFFPKQIRNIEEYACDIKDINVLEEQREKFLNLLKSKKKNKSIAIIGGGLSGVEIALEFAHVLKEKEIDSNECQISLIEQFKDVLPNMDPFLVEQTRNACIALDIKRYHGSFVKEVKNETIFLSDSSKIPFDMVLFLIGVSSEKLVSDGKVEINVKNQFIVDEYLRLNNYKEVYAIGDIAQTQDSNGNYTLPTAQIAKLHGKIAAQNIINTIENKNLIENKSQIKGVMIDLANKNSVGIVLGIKIGGFVAYLLKRFVSKKHINQFN